MDRTVTTWAGQLTWSHGLQLFLIQQTTKDMCAEYQCIATYGKSAASTCYDIEALLTEIKSV